MNAHCGTALFAMLFSFLRQRLPSARAYCNACTPPNSGAFLFVGSNTAGPHARKFAPRRALLHPRLRQPEQREGSLFSCAAAHVPPMHVCPSSFTPLAAFFPSLVGPACRALRPQSNRQLFFFAPISPRHPELPAAGRVESAG